MHHDLKQQQAIRALLDVARQVGQPDTQPGHRRWTRYQLGSSLEISTQPNDPTESCKALLHNLSGGGMGFWSRREFPPGSALFVREDRPDTDGVWLAARVTYSVVGINGHLSGVAFDHPTEPDSSTADNPRSGTLKSSGTARREPRRPVRFSLAGYCALCSAAGGLPAVIVAATGATLGRGTAVFVLAGVVFGAILSWLLARRETSNLAQAARGIADLVLGNSTIPPAGDATTREVCAIQRALARTAQHLALEAPRKEKSVGASPAVASISHELSGDLKETGKSPLTSLQACSRVLEDHLHGLASKDQEQYLRTVSQECARLSRLVTDLLEVQHVDEQAESWPKAPVYLENCIRDLARSFVADADRKGIVFLVECPPAVSPLEANAERLSQAIRHLLSHAFAVTSWGGTVRLALEQRAGELRLTIADQGPGIPRQQWDDVFSRGAPAPITQGSSLFVIRQIVEAHGGKVWLDSEVGRGTEFFISLPINTSATQAPSADAEQERAGNVVVCDTDPALAAQIAHELKKAGYGVNVAHSADRLIDHLAIAPVDVLVSDVVLPDMPTAELLKAIELYRSDGFQFVMHSMDLEWMNCRDCGADIVLRRPAMRDELLKAVDIGMLRRRRSGLLVLLLRSHGVDPETLRTALEEQGHLCFVVDTLATAERLLRDLPFDLAVIRPGLSVNTEEVIATLHSHPRQNTQVMVLAEDAEAIRSTPGSNEHILHLPYRPGREAAVAEAVSAFGREQLLIACEPAGIPAPHP